MVPGQVPLPVGHDLFHARFSGEGNHAVHMVRHEKDEPAVPDQMLVMMRRRGQNSVAYPRPTQVVLAPRLAIDRDEEETPLRHPLRDLVR